MGQAAVAARKGQKMKNRETNDSGVALIVVLLLMLVFTIIMLGLYFQTTGEQKVAASDRDNTAAFYAAQGALENMSSNLANLFIQSPSPTPLQISALTAASYQPSLPNITFPAGGYTITNLPTPANPPTPACTPTATVLCSTNGIIPGTGPLAGLMGIITPFTLTVIADGPNNTEVKMTRGVQEVAVPVWQFGIFSNGDQAFFANPAFSFGGRVHANGNLYLTTGSTLTLNDKVTAAGSIIVTQLENGNAVGNNNQGGAGTAIDVTTGAAGGCPAPTCAALTEGSVAGGPGSAAEANWSTVSMTDFAGNIRDGTTGAKVLNLALAFAGAAPIAMAQRPPLPPAPADNATLTSERFFNLANVRILLSDTQAAITSLPGIDTSVNPYPLAEVGSTGAEPALGDATKIQRTTPGSNNYYLPPTDACHPPLAESFGYVGDQNYLSPAGATLLGGYIKIEVQQEPPAGWKDVTQEVLSLGVMSGIGGMAAPTFSTATSGGTLAKNTTYKYEVTALGPWGESQGTAAAETTGNSTNNNTITVKWTTAVTGATGYKVYRGTGSPIVWAGYFSSAAGTVQYTDTGAAPTAGTPPAPCTNISVVQLEEAGPHYSAPTTATSYIPINIYDPREGELRDTNSFTGGVNYNGITPANTTDALNGVMNLVQVNVGNLQQWLANTLCTAATVPTSCPSGALAYQNVGYTLYFSDRRGNHSVPSKCVPTPSTPSGWPYPPTCPPLQTETGEYGYEDSINPENPNGAPNGVLDGGPVTWGGGAAGGAGGRMWTTTVPSRPMAACPNTWPSMAVRLPHRSVTPSG